MYISLPEKLNTVVEQNQVLEHDCAEIEGLAINTTPEIIGKAEFVDEAATCSAIPTNPVNHYSIKGEEDVQDIKDYLARPRMIASGDISAGAGVLTYLNIPTSAGLRNLVNPVQWDRLKGAVGIRATLKFTLTVTATPFHQGILNLNWQYGTDVDAFPAQCRTTHLPLAYNLPHVLLDMAHSTMVSLEVPYVSWLEYFPIELRNEPTQFYGVVGIMKQTNPRVAVGQNPPEFALYLSLHDVEVVGTQPYITRSVTLQAGSSGKARGLSKANQELKKGGLISKALESTANVARAVSYVPGLNVIGGTADWFLRSASKVASAFGYSKPNDENKPERFNRLTYAGDTHVDVPFQGFTTTPFQTNKLAINSALGCTDDDHMAFDYVLTKPSLIFRGQMSTTTTSGDLLYGSTVCPNVFWYRDREIAGTPTGNLALPHVAGGSVNSFFPSTLLYVGDNFRYWRGDLKFKVTFSKSTMHAGRVQFAYIPDPFVPGANQQMPNTILAPELAPGGMTQPTGMTVVFDLRDGNSFEFDVPYLCPFPYLPVSGSTGCVSMTVVNPLRAPGIAADTIDFLVEVSAAPGFEFACFTPATLGALVPNGLPVPTYAGGAAPQSGQSGLIADLVGVSYQSGVTASVITDDASQNVIGEKFNSLKQLAMIPSYTVNELANNSLTRLSLTPWFKPNGPPVSAPMGNTANDTALWLNAPCMRVANLYSFVNGSTNFQFQRDGGTTANFTASAIQYPNTSGATFTELAGLWNKNQNCAGGVNMFETSEVSRWNVPTFSRYARLPVPLTYDGLGGYQRALTPGGNGQVNYNPVYFSNRVDLVLRNASGASRRYAIGKSAGDDARASIFIGPPPCALYQASAVASPTSAGDVMLGISAF